MRILQLRFLALRSASAKVQRGSRRPGALGAAEAPRGFIICNHLVAVVRGLGSIHLGKIQTGSVPANELNACVGHPEGERHGEAPLESVAARDDPIHSLHLFVLE